MHAAKNEAIALLRAAEKEVRRLDADPDLTPEAKQRHKAEIGNQFIAKLANSPTYARASESVEHVLERYETLITSKLQKASDPHTVGVHAQVRSQLLAIKDPKERLAFLTKHGSDPVLISATLSAPPYLSGLDDGEISLLRANLEKLADPSVLEQRDLTKSSWAALSRGFRAAASRISKRAGLQGNTATPNFTAAKPPAKPVASAPNGAPIWKDNAA
jgi:hypothetical protein